MQIEQQMFEYAMEKTGGKTFFKQMKIKTNYNLTCKSDIKMAVYYNDFFCKIKIFQISNFV